ncbi:glycosyltransferase family 4 protein [Natrinema zhouii]|uniref:Glycosyltransferase family 4 protein n=1 Tax=Natrinema zhouii TaxID=1710539 RepID=A0A7D6GL42_9EURY|nr:glycosyltransferase family 4 protein [Natrinema zhouii]QLK26819.1 glycosyltransferase family 4 protein [Natrinema zhouii]
MHLLVLTEDFYPSVSGGAHARWRFAQIATQRGHDVTVVTPRLPDTPVSEFVDNIEITRPFPSHPSSLPPASSISTATRIVHSGALFGWLQWWARGRRFDAVYSASNTLHWVAAALGRQRGIPSLSFVGYTPSMRPETQSSIKLALERLNFSHGMGDHVFCRVPAIRDLIAERSEADVQLIHGILNDDRIRSAHEHAQEAEIRSTYADPDEQLLVVAGRLSEEKNVPAAVNVLHELPQSYQLVIIGGGPQREAVQNAIDRHEEHERVTMCGELSHEKTLSLIDAADGLLLPSHTEAYPTVAFEGLALGCTVFATPVGILTEVEHPRLHLSPVEDFSKAIQSASLDRTRELDVNTLEEYSMEQFANQILGAIEA